jgi:hypothetical protein
MSCPKCKAKIGVAHQQLATHVGTVFGVMCYICGCWIQGYPGYEERVIKPMEAQAMAP